MDKVVQQNAANAEESASASEEMNAQSQEMKGFVETIDQALKLPAASYGPPEADSTVGNSVNF